MKIFISVCLFFLAAQAFAGPPLESGYALAPKANAPFEEKQKAYLEARNRVLRAAKTYENTPYVYGGMSASGVDCSGFTSLAFKDAIGVNLPRSAAGQYSWVELIPLEKAQAGDLIFFKTDGTGRITHVGLYLGNRHFIHAASIGAKTGVIINNLDEGSWTRNFGGAGRAFPEAAPGYVPVNVINSGSGAASRPPSAPSSPQTAPQAAPAAPSPRPNPVQPSAPSGAPSGAGGDARLLLGAGFAPTLYLSTADDRVFCGFTSHLRLGADTNSFGTRMIIGLELRPEYNSIANVFRLPITLSWGFNDKLRFFGGPVYDSGADNWHAIIGITVSPFILNTSGGEFAPYAEASWQSDERNKNIYDGIRISTGIRWSINVFK